jgi:two-component system response regulator LytT
MAARVNGKVKNFKEKKKTKEKTKKIKREEGLGYRMSIKMKLSFETDKTLNETYVKVISDSYTEEIGNLMNYIEGYENSDKMLSIKESDTVHILRQEEIQAIEVLGGDVKIFSLKEEFTIKERLYKIVERLNKRDFVRVSKSSVININALVKLETYFSGTMIAILRNGQKVTVTRTYLSDLKKKIKI